MTNAVGRMLAVLRESAGLTAEQAARAAALHAPLTGATPTSSAQRIGVRWRQEAPARRAAGTRSRCALFRSARRSGQGRSPRECHE